MSMNVITYYYMWLTNNKKSLIEKIFDWLIGDGSPKVVGECFLDVIFDSKVHRDVKFIDIEKLVSPAILGTEFLVMIKSLSIKFQGDPKVTLAALPLWIYHLPGCSGISPTMSIQ